MNLLIVLIAYGFAYYGGVCIEEGKYGYACVHLLTALSTMAVVLRNTVPMYVKLFKEQS